MGSAAVAAQGTVLYVAGTTSSAINMASCTAGFPTILTFANANVDTELMNGDSVTIAGVTGTDAALLNGVKATVTHKAIGATNTTFIADIDTTGKTIVGTAATVTPTAWIKVGNIKGFKPSNPSTSERVVTDLDSTAVETGGGLTDYGNVSLENFVVTSDAGQTAMQALFNSKALSSFKVTYPSGTTPNRTFPGWVKSFPDVGDASIDGSVTGTIDIRRTGVAVAS